MSKTGWDDLPLGKFTAPVDEYSPSLLRGIARSPARASLTLSDRLPFGGVDYWTAYELTWLNQRGRPECAVLELEIPSSSPSFVESKSLKLYLNSLRQTEFESWRAVERTLTTDIGACCQSAVQVGLVAPQAFAARAHRGMPGRSLDVYDIEARHYQVDPSLLSVESNVVVREAVFSELVSMLCPVTGQPDHATVMIEYTGPGISHVSLLRYLISFRLAACFHEQAVERMFLDILARCSPNVLTVQGMFCRRGGIDINPLRSNADAAFTNFRGARQ